MSLTLSGAYGRDYASAAAARRDFLEGKDFAIRTPGCGSYTSAPELIARSPTGVSVCIRYRNDTRVCVVKIPARPA